MSAYDSATSAPVMDTDSEATLQDEDLVLDASSLATQEEEGGVDDPNDPVEILSREFLETPQEAAEDEEEEALPSRMTARMTARPVTSDSIRGTTGSLRDRASRRGSQPAPALSKRARRHQMVAKLVVYVVPLLVCLVMLALILDKYQVVSLGIFSAPEVESDGATSSRKSPPVKLEGDQRINDMYVMQNDAEMAWNRQDYTAAMDKMRETINLLQTLIDELPEGDKSRKRLESNMTKLNRKLSDWRNSVPANAVDSFDPNADSFDSNADDGEVW